MSTFLTTQSLSFSSPQTCLFEEVNLTLNRHDKIGLIGHNGCGKSTLLKILSQQLDGYHGQIAIAHHCVVGYVEQQLPPSVANATTHQALAEHLDTEEHWRVDVLLSELGFAPQSWHQQAKHLSGGQQMRLLLARAVIHRPDVLLLDEPSNHLDLPALLWLEHYLRTWKGAFVLVSHDERLLDNVTTSSWIVQDKRLHHFSLPCSAARLALSERNEADRLRHYAEQKEIDRLESSAKRLATWGKVYDNEDLARKAKTIQARKERLEEQQTKLAQAAPWCLSLQGESLSANRLLNIEQLDVTPPFSDQILFSMALKQIKSGDRIALIGANGQGKSSLLKRLFSAFQQAAQHSSILNQTVFGKIAFHPKCTLGYYDQSLLQVDDRLNLSDALMPFCALSDDLRKQALISAGFEYQRHNQKVSALSGGERARLLFIGLSLARYHMLFLDEPTNHLDIEGKQQLIETLNDYQGAALIVSHDRNVIEHACNRFWLIQNQTLSEYLDIAQVYQQLDESHDASQGQMDTSLCSPLLKMGKVNDSQFAQETLLERLIELEQRLNDDLARKPKHQKPQLQAQWQEEIMNINRKLS